MQARTVALALALTVSAGAGACHLGPLTSDALFPGSDAGADAGAAMMCGAADAGGGGGGDEAGASLCDTRYHGLVGCMCRKDSNVRDNAPCTVGVDQPCYTTCGPLGSGTQNCACIADPDGGADGAGGVWRCPSCGYDPAPAKSYACFQRPVTPTLCPKDGTLPIRHGAPCAAAPCMPCGSENDDTYRDSAGVNKKGFCVCSDVTNGKWSCASSFEWPPACLTDRT